MNGLQAQPLLGGGFALSHAPVHPAVLAPQRGWALQVEHGHLWQLGALNRNEIHGQRRFNRDQFRLSYLQQGQTVWNRQTVSLTYTRSLKRLVMGLELGVGREWGEGATAPRYGQRVNAGAAFQPGPGYRLVLVASNLFPAVPTPENPVPGSSLLQVSLGWSPVKNWEFSLDRLLIRAHPAPWIFCPVYRPLPAVEVRGALRFPQVSAGMEILYRQKSWTFRLGYQREVWLGPVSNLVVLYAF